MVMLQVLTYLNWSLHQNKLLHSRLEAKHLNSAEKNSRSGTISSGSTDSDHLEDSGLQRVVHYLRRTKEIVRELPLQDCFSFLYAPSLYCGVI